MNVVGIDTSTKNLVIAVVKDGELVHSTNFFSQRDHAKVILNLFDEALKASGLLLNDLDRFVCGVGPGSFTGLRVGHAFVRGLMKTDDEKVIPVSSFEWIAYHGTDLSDTVLVVQDAKRDQLFVSLFKKTEKGLEVALKDQVLDLNEVEKLVSENAGLVVTGSGLKRYGETIQSWGNLQLAPEEIWVPRAEDFLKLIADKNLEQAIPSRELLPNYLRLSDAEENLKDAS